MFPRNVLPFPRNGVCVCCFVRKQQRRHEMCANTTECKESFTLTPSACACRPGALRPWVLTPGVGAGWGLGAGVVKTCVFPEPCKLLDDRTLPRLPTLPLRSPPPHINTRCRAQHYTHATCLTHIISFFSPTKARFQFTCQRFAQHPDVLTGAALLSQSGRALRTQLCSS